MLTRKKRFKVLRRKIFLPWKVTRISRFFSKSNAGEKYKWGEEAEGNKNGIGGVEKNSLRQKKNLEYFQYCCGGEATVGKRKGK